jgi:dipeptidyl aminopeptidase/acylaminoacyl peptidase
VRQQFKPGIIILSVLWALGLMLMLAACGDVANTALPAATVSGTTGAASTTAVATTVAATTASVTTVAPTSPPTVTPPATSTAGAVTTAASTTAPAVKTPQLAYVEGGNLVTVNPASGEKKTLFSADAQGQSVVGRPDWSPDGVVAVAVQAKAGGNSQIYLFNVTSSAKTPVAQTASASDSEPKWSPDGKLLAFTRTLNGKHEIWLVDRDGQNPRKLTNGQQPTWASDSARIAFVTDRASSAPQYNALHLINAQGQNEWEPINVAKIPTDLSDQGYPFGPSTTLIQYPTWLDGNKTLAFTTEGHSGLLITINASTGKDLKVWDTQYEGGFGYTQSNPQGSLVVYEGFPPSGYNTIRMISTAGKPDLQNPTGITIGSPKTQTRALYPALSADGSQLAYFKVVGTDASGDPKMLSGTLVVAQVKSNGQLEEKELLKAKVLSIAWSK